MKAGHSVKTQRRATVAVVRPLRSSIAKTASGMGGWEEAGNERFKGAREREREREKPLRAREECVCLAQKDVPFVAQDRNNE